MSLHVISTALFCTAMLIYILMPGSLHALQTAIEHIGKWGGGPPRTPRHPVPANDSRLLFKRAKKIEYHAKPAPTDNPPLF